MNRDPLSTPVQYLKGIGPVRARALEEAGLRTLLDLLYGFPRRYFDRRSFVPIAMVREGENQTVQGVIESVRERVTPRKKMHLTEVLVTDGTGRIPVRFFNQRYLPRMLKEGETLVVTGGVSESYGLHLNPVEYEILTSEDDEPIHTCGLVPSYVVPAKFGRKSYRRLVWTLLQEHADELPEILPPDLRSRRGLIGGQEAVRQLHFPVDAESLRQARERMAYEELLLLQAHLALKRSRVAEEEGIRLGVTRTLDFRIRSLFPFRLTGAQERAVLEIRRDLASGHPMNRLLQGDVGSGKTAVAAYALLVAVGRRMQAAILAPTEVLARQHFATFSRMLEHSKVRIAFLGGEKDRERPEILSKIESGEIDVVVGTHAMIQEGVRFRRLALGVIDEQQKFGVMQRAAFRRKGESPHLLVMTATPIPRTLVMTSFGDLEVSVLDEMPPGRKPVRTLLRPPSRRAAVYEFVRRKIREGRQAYVVAPFIEESEKQTVTAAVTLHGELARLFPDVGVGLLHGRMKEEERGTVMSAYREGKLPLLVSTLVIEVGVDVPNATVMVIEQAERYGLSQLHQLRGRVGRGGEESFCIAISERVTERLKAFGATTDGFRLAEEDLRIRGPGEILGTRQSGFPEFRVANLLEDRKLLDWAQEDARRWLARDPSLARGTGPLLRRLLQERFGRGLSLATVG